MEIAKSYREYLALEHILNAGAQRLSDKDENKVHDETLFIIMHQTIELWFYQALEECREARDLIRADKIGSACEELERIARIFVVLTASWDVLATLRPGEFWKFRQYFGKASGFQSSQFREFEFSLGLRENATRDLKVHKKLEDHDACQRLDGELNRPSLWDEVNLALGRAGFTLPAEITSRSWREPYPYPRQDGTGRAARIIKGCAKAEKAWLRIHAQRTKYADFYHLGERLLDISAAFSSWRYKHIVTVERFIGGLPGTGGSPGVPYLLKTLEKRAFPELWSTRDRFKVLGRIYRASAP